MSLEEINDNQTYDAKLQAIEERAEQLEKQRLHIKSLKDAKNDFAAIYRNINHHANYNYDELTRILADKKQQFAEYKNYHQNLQKICHKVAAIDLNQIKSCQNLAELKQKIKELEEISSSYLLLQAEQAPLEITDYKSNSIMQMTFFRALTLGFAFSLPLIIFLIILLCLFIYN